MTTTTESKWDRSKRLEAEFPAWCAAVAAHLKATVFVKHNDTPPSYRYLRLSDGLTFCLNLDSYEARVSIAGDWPQDDERHAVSPRDVSYSAVPAGIHLGVGREPLAAAKDIERRFLSVYREQHAACAAKVVERAEYRRTVEAGAARIAAVLKLSKGHNEFKGGEVRLYAHDSPFVYDVHVSDKVRFELRGLSVEQAEQVLCLVQTFTK